MTTRLPIIAALAVAAVLVAAYLAAGGGSYEPTAVADPCQPREWREPDGLDESAQQFSLSALDGAACELGVSRERLAIALATPDEREALVAERGIDEAEFERAIRAGLLRAIDDAEAAGALDGTLAGVLREIAARLPVDEAIAVIEDGGDFLAAGGEAIDGLLDRARALLP